MPSSTSCDQNNLWLEQLPNRVAMGPLLVGLSATALLVMALLAVASQTNLTT
jgi:hypothetical protein